MRACVRAAVAGLASLGLALASAMPADAQTRPPSSRAAPVKPPDPKEPPPPPPETPAPYDRDLMRLSELLGSLAFLRELCASPDAAEWKARMGAILDTEGSTPGRRERLAGAYNRGFRGYALTYRVCTPAAVEASARFIAEGQKLSQSLAGRYGG